MLYDIRNEQQAAKTLERLTGVPESYWVIEGIKNSTRFDFADADKDIEHIISMSGGHFPKLEELELIVTHITTSNNRCISIIRNGLIGLVKAYKLPESELRQFLETNDVEIDVDSSWLIYKDECYDISYGKCPLDHESREYAAWSVGRKLYYDFTVCGFLSLNEKNIYGGYVHRRPEILSDIDDLLGTELQEQWEESHRAYEVVFKVPVYETVYNGWDSDDEYERVMRYLVDAYMCVFTGPDTQEILCRNGVEIMPEHILECKEFNLWV